MNSVGEWEYNPEEGNFLDFLCPGSMAAPGVTMDFNVGISFVDPFANSYDKLLTDNVLVHKEILKICEGLWLFYGPLYY